MVPQNSNDHQILLYALLYTDSQVHIFEWNFLFNKWFSTALRDRDDSRTFCKYIMPNSKCVKSYNIKQHNAWTLTGLPTASQFLQRLASSWNLPQCMNWRTLWLVGILHPVEYLVMAVWCLKTNHTSIGLHSESGHQYLMLCSQFTWSWPTAVIELNL